jgi:AAHS family 4-hydroxybenzoate transporter-like MFS transporter
VVIAALYSVGGLVALFVVTPLCDRYNRYAVLAAALTLGAVAIVAIGLAGNVALPLGIAIFFAGLFTFGSQNATNAIAVNSYPADIRSTGSGWTLGIGRFGQIVGPLWGGWLLALHWPGNSILYVVAVPALLSAVVAGSMLGMAPRPQPAA